MLKPVTEFYLPCELTFPWTTAKSNIIHKWGRGELPKEENSAHINLHNSIGTIALNAHRPIV
jgi:hypothetical protein